jgi:precorrin-8X/cobalt-precorrin-8 methylmutase
MFMDEPKAIPLNAAGRDIENRSMAIIEAEVGEPRPFSGDQWLVVRRMIHASADFELLDLVRFHPLAVQNGLAALERGCAVVTDTHMAAAALPARLYEPLGCSVRCLIKDPRTLQRARGQGSTRAAAAVDVAALEHPDAIWVIGNAPTALLRLIELVRAGRVCPALIIGMPVGFVQAFESKEVLLKLADTPYILIRGRKGGSALAASALNALAMRALDMKAQGCVEKI